MSKKNKLLQKFLKQPATLHYLQLEKILLQIGFHKISAKGSHQKFKHPQLKTDLIIPVHNSNCHEFYKKLASKIVRNNHLSF